MNILTIFHIVVSLLLAGAVLLQNSSGGLGSAFGQGASYHTKRGMERTLFYGTIVLATIFTITSVIILI